MPMVTCYSTPCRLQWPHPQPPPCWPLSQPTCTSPHPWPTPPCWLPCQPPCLRHFASSVGPAREALLQLIISNRGFHSWTQKLVNFETQESGIGERCWGSISEIGPQTVDYPERAWQKLCWSASPETKYCLQVLTPKSKCELVIK